MVSGVAVVVVVVVVLASWKGDKVQEGAES